MFTQRLREADAVAALVEHREGIEEHDGEQDLREQVARQVAAPEQQRRTDDQRAVEREDRERWPKGAIEAELGAKPLVVRLIELDGARWGSSPGAVTCTRASPGSVDQVASVEAYIEAESASPFWRDIPRFAGTGVTMQARSLKPAVSPG